MKTKRCSKCGNILPLSKFSKHRGNKDGLQAYCKKCAKETHKLYYISNRSLYLAQSRKYFKTHKEQCRRRSRLYYRKHREEIIERVSKKYRSKKEQVDRHLAACGKYIRKSDSRQVECVQCRKVAKSDYDKCLMIAATLGWYGWEAE